jgi:hypothetical protein
LIARLTIAALLASLSPPAMAAGDTEWPPFFWIIESVAMFLMFVVPAVGVGFFLQGFLRARNAVLLVTALALVVPGWCLSSRGLEKTLELVSLFLLLIAFFSALIAFGWYLGIKDQARATARKKLA